MKSITHCATSLVMATLISPAAIAQISVLTQDYDMSRSGANLGEAILTPSNVSSATFGKLFAYPVDEEVFAQPLYVPGLVIDGGAHNVVFIATMGNSVYAFDADNPATSAGRSGASTWGRVFRRPSFSSKVEAAFRATVSFPRRSSIRVRTRSTC